jgi:hypothetical protein
MVGMLDYNLHYAVMATEDRVRDAIGWRRGAQPLQPRKGPRFRRARPSAGR